MLVVIMSVWEARRVSTDAWEEELPQVKLMYAFRVKGERVIEK
jgi:hypothetical protein